MLGCRGIWQLIFNNARVIEGISLQLVEVNQTTLKPCYNRRGEARPQAGIAGNQPSPFGFLWLQRPQQQLVFAPLLRYSSWDKHAYSRPRGTAGQA